MKCLPLAVLLAIILPSGLRAQERLETRVFEVMPDFLQVMQRVEMNPPVPLNPDPFATAVVPEKKEMHRDPFAIAPEDPPLSTRALLEKMGIPFPDGAAVFLDSPNHRLHVRHLPVYLDLIQSLIDGQDNPHFVSLTTHLIQAPGPLLRAMAQPGPGKGDATDALKRLLLDSSKDGSNVKVVNTSHLEMKPGERATLEAVTESHHVGSAKVDAKGTAVLEMENRSTGFKLEVEPYISVEADMLDLNLALEFTAGQKMPPFQSATVKTALNLASGQSRLLNLWKPSANGDPQMHDTLQALFLTAEIIQVKPIRKPTTDPVKFDLLRPKEPLTHVFSMPDDGWRWDEQFFEQQYGRTYTSTFKLNQALTSVCQFTPKDSHHFEVKGDLETQEVFQRWVTESWNLGPKNLGVTLDIVRGSGHVLRPLLARSHGLHDHATILQAARELVSASQAQWSTTAYIQAKPGTKAMTQSACERRYISKMQLSDPQHPQWETESQPLGTILEIDPVLSEDGHIIHLPCTLTWQTAPPTPPRESLTVGNGCEIPRSDPHLARLKTAGIYMDGNTRLIAAWHPQGDETLNRDDVLEMAFVTVNVLKRSPSPTEVQPEPLPEPEKKDPNKMETRSFRVPPDFLSLGGQPTDAEELKKSWSDRARYILEEQGIAFPEGSRIFYIRGSNRLWVTQTPDNLDLIEAFIGSFCCSYAKSLAFNLHLFQADGNLIRDLLRQAVYESSDAPLKQLLEGVGAGTVLPVSTLRLITEGGQRATVEQVQEHQRATGFMIGSDAKTETFSEIRSVGTRMELDPTMGADGYTIDVDLTPEHHTAAPLRREEDLLSAESGKARKLIPLTDFYAEKICASLTLFDGTSRIIAVWKPTGKPEFETQDILHIAILEAGVIHVHE